MNQDCRYLLSPIDPPQKLQDLLLGDSAAQLVLPSVVAEIMVFTEQDDFSMKDLEAFVLKDAKLAVEILRLANSPLFATGRPTTSLLQAVVRLGTIQCRNIIHSVCVSQMLESISLEQEWLREVLCRHGLTTAETAVKINRALGLGFKGEEYTAGLLHDFGRTLLAVTDEQLFVTVDNLDFENELATLEKEQDAFGIDHCSLGAWYATQCGLPEPLVTTTQFHHSPNVKQPHQELTALICAADEIANHVQRYEDTRPYNAEENKGIQVLAELLGSNILDNFSQIVPELTREVQASSATANSTLEGSFDG